MKLTSEMKKYIRHEVQAKANAQVCALKAELQKMTDEDSKTIRKVSEEVSEHMRTSREQLARIARKYGLTPNDESYNIRQLAESADFSFGDFLETDYTYDSTNEIHLHRNNKKARAIEDKIVAIGKRIDAECGRIFFNLEVGKDRKCIEDILATIDFTK